jgi:predicted nucleic acid-binding protein
MKILVDTNILLRLSEKDHPHYPIALGSLRRLGSSGQTFCIGSQTISEFLAVATRSAADRGLGMSAAVADAELSKAMSALEVLYDSAAVLDELRSLVVKYRIAGKSVHDARLVATMNVNGVRDILTFNIRDFGRYAGLNILDPTTFSAASTDSTNRAQ